MKITNLNAVVVSLPRTDTLVTSYSQATGATTVVVTLDTDAGLVGIGQTAVAPLSYGETAEGIRANILTHLAPVVMGESPLDIERLVKKMEHALPDHWSSHAGVEIALWDLKGKALGVPIYQLLGGKVREGVDLMGFVHHGKPEAMAAHATATLDRTPFPVLKMKIGLDPDDDVRRYAAVAAAVAGRSVIQVDGNAGYTLDQAVPALARMEACGSLGIVEQPVARWADMAVLARRLNTPLMADEAIYPPPDALEVVRMKAATVALMKITKHGGILNVWKIASIFEAAGFDLSIAIYYDVIAVAAAHLAAAISCARWPSPFTDLNDTILSEPYEPEGLLLRVPEKPGLGVELDMDKVERYRVQ